MTSSPSIAIDDNRRAENLIRSRFGISLNCFRTIPNSRSHVFRNNTNSTGDTRLLLLVVILDSSLHSCFRSRSDKNSSLMSIIQFKKSSLVNFSSSFPAMYLNMSDSLLAVISWGEFPISMYLANCCTNRFRIRRFRRKLSTAKDAATAIAPIKSNTTAIDRSR